MDLSTLSQYGIAAIFIAASYKFYMDMKDIIKQQREDSLNREHKLMEHLDKVCDTLEKIDTRLCTLEKKVGE